ncbi:MAG: PIN domain nuclease [Acidobacteria bacterium]|nr:MAG: PIN domain nuclease [Acidobacteriota bacterium]
MSVLVDTSIWSLALRRRSARLNADERNRVEALRRLIELNEAKLIGAVRQELLSGIKERKEFEALRDELRNFQDEPLDAEDYERAAEMTNRLTSIGITCSPIDVLICAVAKQRDWEIFSTDRDFERYSKEFDCPLFRISRQK